MNTSMSSFRRVSMYVVPVAVVSVALNIPKFLETEASTANDNSTEIKTSDMRMEPTYMLYFTISQVREKGAIAREAVYYVVVTSRLDST